MKTGSQWGKGGVAHGSGRGGHSVTSGARGGGRGRGSIDANGIEPVPHQGVTMGIVQLATEAPSSIPARGRRRFLARMGAAYDEHDGTELSQVAQMGPVTWSVAEVGKWLSELGYKQYVGTFKQNHITGAVLPLLSKDVMQEELGIASLGHRLLILQGVHKLLPEAPVPVGGAGAAKLTEVATQAGKTASIVITDHAEISKVAVEVEKLKKGLLQTSDQLDELVRALNKPEPSSLSADAQARLNKSLKQAENAASAVAELRVEMFSITSSLAIRLKQGLARLDDAFEQTPARAQPAAAQPAAPTAADTAADKPGVIKGKADKKEKSAKALERKQKGETKPAPSKPDQKAGPKFADSKPSKPANQAALGAKEPAGVLTGDTTQAGAQIGRGGGEAAMEGSRGGKGRSKGAGAAGSASLGKESEASPAIQIISASRSTVAIVLGGANTSMEKCPAFVAHATPAAVPAVSAAPTLLEARLSVRSLCEVHLFIDLF